MAEQEKEDLIMKLRTVISSLALVSAMAFSGGAMAQSMIGGVEVPADQWPTFQEKCAALNAAATQTLAEPVENDDATETGSGIQRSTLFL
ncbi:MAG: hypothetical protein EOP19_08905, partial [Hyphomicrobiales bacterium]